MAAFLLGVLGTSIGTALGVWLLPLGEEAHNLAGIFSATYIGGSMNFVAVAETLQIDKALLTPSYAADNVVGVMYLAMLAGLPAVALARRWLPSPIIENVDDSEIEIENTKVIIPLNIMHLCILLGLSLIIVAVSNFMAARLGVDNYSILFITAIAVLIANLFPKQMDKLHGHFELGMLLMYLFFASVGASADIIQMIASNACISGAATAAGLAAGKRWHHLVTPGLLCGIFGYVLANFIGVMIATYLMP